MKQSSCLPDCLLICIGNEYRHDDGVGPFIGRQLRKKGLKGLKIVENSGDSMAMMDAFGNEDAVILIDAVHSGQAAGTIFCFDAIADPMPEDIFAVSSHDISIQQCLALTRSLGIFPEKLIFYGIEGTNYNQGKGLSAAVKKAALALVERIIGDLG